MMQTLTGTTSIYGETKKNASFWGAEEKQVILLNKKIEYAKDKNCLSLATAHTNARKDGECSGISFLSEIIVDSSSIISDNATFNFSVVEE